MNEIECRTEYHDPDTGELVERVVAVHEESSNELLTRLVASWRGDTEDGGTMAPNYLQRRRY